MSDTLVLHVRVPGIYADDLKANADEFYDGDVGVIVLEELIRADVGITIVTLPGEKCQNSEFGIHSFTGTVVGAEVQQ